MAFSVHCPTQEPLVIVQTNPPSGIQQEGATAMDTRWKRLIGVAAQVVLLVSVWSGASAMVTSTISGLHSVEPLVIPVSILAALGAVATAHFWLRNKRRPRKVLEQEGNAAGLALLGNLDGDWREQLIGDLRIQVAALHEEREHLQRLLRENTLRLKQDALTGIYNRLAYDEHLQHEYERWQRFGNQLALLVWDVDFFKKINDNYGHALGDEVLRHIARQLNMRLRSTDFVARYGGEEFVMLLPGADSAAAWQLAETIRRHIAAAVLSIGPCAIQVTISCGISSFQAEDSPHSVFARADRALYQAKHAGRNCCKIA